MFASRMLVGATRQPGRSMVFLSRMNNSRASRSRTAKLRRGARKPSTLYIFDKDGTLINFDRYLAPWAKLNIHRVASEASAGESSKYEELVRALCTQLHCCPETGMINSSKSCLVSSSDADIRKELVAVLESKGICTSSAKDVVHQSWSSEMLVTDETVSSIGDLKGLLAQLRSKNNAKFAICTADSKRNTLLGIKLLGLEGWFDAVLCDDDYHPSEQIYKPHPACVHKLCVQLDVPVSRTFMVGDSLHDMSMGRAAGATAVGVLTGKASALDLKSHNADFVFPNIHHIAQMQ